MTTSIILGRKRNSKSFHVVSGPLPPDDQNKKFNKLSVSKGNGLAEISLHEIIMSEGRKRKTFPAK